ncbi:fibronectin type III domain-containing protein, partial [Gelidibacter salicanalis]
PSFSVTGLTADTTYYFTVLAYDLAGNVSLQGNILEVQTTASAPIPYTSANANLSTVDWQAKDLFVSQQVGIATTPHEDYKLTIAGKVIAEGVKVALQGSWPDYVFLKEYRLPSLEEVESHILNKGHLIDLPSARNIKLKGIDLGEMDALLLKKIEELTLYILQQEKKIIELQKINGDLKILADRIIELERKMEE